MPDIQPNLSGINPDLHNRPTYPTSSHQPNFLPTSPPLANKPFIRKMEL